ncbi:hypothetical protein M409DRAFT_48954 [Zasmidium cellare ATCC 36951]|uniref:N-acetyltransferase domain-containing protein n=1 Tax=Zasmidium cellare ATCC 36951 TaxID=1080233 RepID=A0A6A6D6Z0_ZASCE|nr:uncharacterized protein M409DRAFT_48954 [Zasmidium cellare ATCC 36951]KAF2174070.1 hypothetical protein M409DRAFT_48954 [Zasmidium cellare ATCC 36951]
MSSEFAPWNSAHLSYRAVEQDDETGVLYQLGRDAEAFNNAVPFMPTPQGSNAAKSYKTYLESCLLGVIICVTPSTPAKIESYQPSHPDPGEAVGVLTLTGPGQGREHHGRADIAISILAPHRGKGYGSEAIQWALCWGFSFARLHRIGIGAIEFNKSAKKLYLKLGFAEESVKRDFAWKYGRWWSFWEASMLEDEWRGKYGSTISYASYMPIE